MSDINKCQRSKQAVQELIEELKPQLMFASYLNDSEQVKHFNGKMKKLEKALKLIDYNLAKLQIEAHQEAA